MGVRVNVRIEGAGGKSLTASALLNGGFETSRPCVLLPAGAAAGTLDDPHRGSPLEAEVAGGEAEFLQADEVVDVRVVEADREGPAVSCAVLISERDSEILLSDSAIDALGVEIKSFGAGTWRFAGENRLRQSRTAKLW